METPSEVRQRAVAASSPARSARKKAAASSGAQEPQGAAATSATECNDDQVKMGPVDASEASAAAWDKRGRPCGTKLAKEEQKMEKQREHAMKAQARATADIAAANFKKAQILEDQAAVSLFTMPDDSNLSAQAREYLELRREEELEKPRTRVAKKKAEQARLKALAERKARERAAEVAAATAKRVPPAPIQPPSPPLRPSTQLATPEGPRTSGSQIPNGVREGELDDEDGHFNEADGEFDVEGGGNGIGGDIIFKTQEQFPNVPAYTSQVDPQHVYMGGRPPLYNSADYAGHGHFMQPRPKFFTSSQGDPSVPAFMARRPGVVGSMCGFNAFGGGQFRVN